MPTMTLRWTLAAAGLLGYAAFAWYFGGDALGQRKEPVRVMEGVRAQNKADGKKKLDEVYYGVSACANKGCHGGDPPKNWVKSPDGKQLDLLSRCIEYDVWMKSDKHADAYNVLTKARGKRMAKILGYDVTDPKGKGKACLACHAVVIEDEKVRKASVEAGFDIKEGVNCVACHGPHVEWVAQHGLLLTASKFRPLSRQVKEDEYGMRDLWDPVKRTELCSSCHVGSVKQGKFVTHEMYAAGHPPLPGFEAATFSNEMPRHWEYLREKSPAIQKELGLKPGEMEQTNLVLVGAAISLRDNMRLLEAQAAKAARATKENDKVLDLSNFDCYACHHDLKSPSWRQKPGYYKGKPGRVPMRPWSTELVKLAIRYLATVDKSADDRQLLTELNGGMKRVIAAFDARPYGDPARIETAAGQLAGWSDKLARRMNATYPKEQAAKSLLAGIPKLYGKTLMDYDSARQVAWAYEVLFNEANGYKGGSSAVRKTLADLDKELKLRLPKGRTKLIEDELAENLKKINNYNPENFQALLLRLGRTGK
jgi:hypothetical protein